jgi:hypothetical protein
MEWMTTIYHVLTMAILGYYPETIPYPLVNVYTKRWKDPPFFMGKLTISTEPCSIAM